jgi:hypothetical protein
MHPWKVIRVASRFTSESLCFNDVAELLESKYPRYRFFVENGKAFLLIGCPSLGYPLDNPLGLFT